MDADAKAHCWCLCTERAFFVVLGLGRLWLFRQATATGLVSLHDIYMVPSACCITLLLLTMV